MPQPVLTVRGEFGGGLDELVAEKLTVVARHAHHPVLAIHIELDRHPDPAVEEPVVAKANIDLNGRLVRAEASARTARGAVGRLMDKVVRQLDDRPRASTTNDKVERATGQAALLRRDVEPVQVGRHERMFELSISSRWK
jgi:ribosome-associated translation inhibitor RaiA